MDIDQIIEGGMTFRPARKSDDSNGKVKTKAKKKAYKKWLKKRGIGGKQKITGE